MDLGNNFTFILVEFDTLKGPVIRKIDPKDFTFPTEVEIDQILIWILRASEFSVRKVGEYTAYARTISLNDPNFQRKKRQFGLAVITKETIKLEIADKILNSLLNLAQKRGNNQPYFKMLHILLEITGNAQEAIIKNNEASKQPQDKKAAVMEQEPQVIQENQFEQFLLMSNRLKTFNKVAIIDKQRKVKTIISSADIFGKVDKIIGQLEEIPTNRFVFQVDINGLIPQEIVDGFNLMSRILNTLPDNENLNEKLIVAIEFLDRLLTEELDIEYYLPFLQYFTVMANYTITEFSTEEYEKQLPSLQETHGDWIKSLSGINIDGKRLTDFFKITGCRREGLELLIDLLFMKIIAIY
jgi:hypothetical protein